MARSRGRAYVFVRWSGSPLQPARLGEVGWAFEYNDASGRFNCFYYGAFEVETRNRTVQQRLFWHERCLTLPDLTKAMSSYGIENPGYDEVKVFEVEEADPDAAIQLIAQRSVLPDEVASRRDLIEETREMLARYGVRGLPGARGFSAPFLWYNMLPGKSVPVRKMAVHLFQLSQASETAAVSPAELEDQVRQIVSDERAVLEMTACFISRIGPRFFVGLVICVNGDMTVSASRSMAAKIESLIRGGSAPIQHIFIQVEAASPKD